MAGLPQANTNSFIKRPKVPIVNSTKALHSMFFFMICSPLRLAAQQCMWNYFYLIPLYTEMYVIDGNYPYRTGSRQVRSFVLTSMMLSALGSAPLARTFRRTVRPPLTVHFPRLTFSHDASGTTRTRSEP